MGRARVGQEEQDEAESDDVEVVELDAYPYEVFEPMGAERRTTRTYRTFSAVLC